MDAPDDIAALKERLERLAERESWFRARSVQEVLALKKTIKLLRAENSSLRDLITERDTQIHELNLARVADRDDRHALTRDLETYAIELTRAEHAAAAAAQRLSALRASPSWRLTAPLRTLLKWFDRRRPAPGPRAIGAPPAEEPAYSFTYYFHTSPFRPLRDEMTLLRGWILPPPPHQIQGVRVRLHDRITAGRFGLAEPEVAEYHHLTEPHHRPGFELPLSLPAGVHPAVFEVQLEDGSWTPFLELPLRRITDATPSA